MGRKEKLAIVKTYRLKIIKELEAFYLNSFNKIAELDIAEGEMARLSQILLQSKDAAINPLKTEVEKPLITKSHPNN